MKAIVNSSLLGKELKKMSSAVKTHTVLPILTCVKLDFQKTSVTAMVSDLETTIQAVIPCECSKPFLAIMDFSNLVDLCHKLPNQPVAIDASGKTITIVSDNGKVSFAKVGSESEFPKIPEESFHGSFKVDARFISSLLKADQCSHEDMFRTNMNTACIDIRGKEIIVVGTNSLLLFKEDFNIDCPAQAKLQPSNSFVEAIKHFEEADISFGEKFIKAEYKNFTIYSRLQDSKFVDYEPLVSKKSEYNLTIDRRDFIHSLSISKLTTQKSTHYCSLIFDGNVMRIKSEDVDIGNEGELSLTVQSSVKIDSVGINASHMVQLMNLVDAGEMEFAIREPTQTISIRPKEDSRVTMLIVPLFV